MIDLDEWLKGLDEEDDREVRDNEEYQRKLFSEYVLRKNDKFSAKRAELAERFEHGEPLTGPDGLRRELAAFDLSYFGRAYLPHYFTGNPRHSMKNWMRSGQKES